MNDSKIELRITDVNDVTCPTCSRQATGYESRPRPGLNPSPITSLDPCGHRVDQIVWTQEALEQRARGVEWAGGRDD